MTPHLAGSSNVTEKPTLLPDFIIIGAMKSGTTTLYRHLIEHPAIDMSREKETDFFVAEKNWNLGLDWYSSQFSPDGDRKRGEASPNYTKCRDFPGVAERMAQHCPGARLIYVVRDPVTRAESQFRHSFIIGTLSLELEGFTGSHEYAHIMDASHYARQLDPYLAHYSKEAILIVDFDDLIKVPQTTMDRVVAHIGVAPHPLVNRGAQNDSAELSRIPAPILRFAQSRTGRALSDLVSRQTRDRIRGALARGRSREAPPFPETLLTQMRADLATDIARFREMSGLRFANWTV